MADEDAMLARAKEYEERAKKFSNKGFNFTDADLKAGDFSKVSRKDIQNILGMDRANIAELLGVNESDEAVNDFLINISKAWNEGFKELPSPLAEWVKKDSELDLEIVEKFNKDIKGISDKTLQELGTGLTTLLDNDINIDTFTDKLSSIDWT
jgi:hypothetical protein